MVAKKKAVRKRAVTKKKPVAKRPAAKKKAVAKRLVTKKRVSPRSAKRLRQRRSAGAQWAPVRPSSVESRNPRAAQTRPEADRMQPGVALMPPEAAPTPRGKSRSTPAAAASETLA